MITSLLALLIIYQVKHFLADYPLQSGFMLKKFLPGWDFFFPLVAHCAVHAAMTLGIVMWWNPALWWLALVDFGVHFVMDRIKAGPKYLGRYKALSGKEYVALLDKKTNQSIAHFRTVQKKLEKEKKAVFRGNVFFWWSLGLDQMVHHLTHYYIIWRLLIG